MNERRTTGLVLTLPLLVLPAFGAGENEGYGKSFDDEARAELTSLWTQALEDAKNGVEAECNGQCSEKGKAEKAKKAANGEECAEECTEACPWGESAGGKLFVMLSKYPGALEAVQPLAVDTLKNKRTSDAEAEAVFDLLLSTKNAQMTTVAEAIYEQAPARFDADKLVTLCELGSTTLIEPLHKMVKKGDTHVVAAAFLASKGDSVGKKALKKAFSAKDITVDNALEVLVAGMGLADLGDARALQSAQMRVHAATIAALDAGKLDEARALAVRASVCAHAMERSNRAMSWMWATCDKELSVCEEKGELKTAMQVFELIEEVTPVV